MKNDTTFVRMRSGDHLGDAKMSKKGTSLRRSDDFTPCFRLSKTITMYLSKVKKCEAAFCMSMMNKCAKFHKDSPSGKS